MPGKQSQTADAPPEGAPLLRPAGRVAALGAALRGAPAWAATHRRRAWLLALGCVVSLGVLAAVWFLIAAHRAAGEQMVTLEMALDALDHGAWAEARRMAENLQQQPTLPMGDYGGPAFVLGAVAAREAEESWNKNKAPQYLVAARYLEDARSRGFPAGREAEGTYLLGKSLYLAGQIPASRLALRDALKLNPQQATEIHGLLAAANLNDANPQLDQAIAENSLFLADRRLSSTARNEGLLVRAQILLAQDKAGECLAALDTLPPHSDLEAQAILLRGQVQMREAQALAKKTENPAEEQADQAKIKEKFQAAIKTLQLAESRDTLSSQATQKAMYLSGICYQKIGDPRAALAQFARIRSAYPQTQEALAAALEEAELARQMGHDDEALAGYRRVLAAVTDPENFSNRWITIDALRTCVLAAYRHFLSKENFDAALKLSRMLVPLLPRTQAWELLAEAYLAWGQALAVQADRLPAARAAALRKQSRAQFRHAGKVYGRLAQLEIASRRYPEQLWNCASAYFDGQDYRHVIPALRQYLENESRQRHAQALVLLGESLLAVDQTDKALEAFRQCVTFHPRDAAAARARLLASKAHGEKGDAKQAEALLRENLNDEYLTPAGKEWRDSLFALGELLHLESRYAEGIRYLDEALERYADSPRAPLARYLLADCYRCSAQLMAEQTAAADLPQSVRAARQKESHDLLQKALAQYRQLQQALTLRRRENEAAPLEKLLLRNCSFAIGGALVDLGQYEEAVQVYLALVNQYRDALEALQAYVELSGAYRRWDKPREARSSLAQAKVMLAHMKIDPPRGETTNYDHKQWGELLDSLSKL